MVLWLRDMRSTKRRLILVVASRPQRGVHTHLGRGCPVRRFCFAVTHPFHSTPREGRRSACSAGRTTCGSCRRTARVCLPDRPCATPNLPVYPFGCQSRAGGRLVVGSLWFLVNHPRTTHCEPRTLLLASRLQAALADYESHNNLG